jgi:tripartite ATP-independent transporter DctM subunit
MSSSFVAFAIVVLLGTLFLKMPVFISLLAGSATYFVLQPQLPAQIMAQRVIAGMEVIPLLAIPFFVCAGIIMNYSGVTSRIMRFAEVLMRRVPGGLAQVNVSLSLFMGGLSGSNLADAAMEAKMLVPEMEKRGFSKEFSTVITAVSAIIVSLLPPSVSMILYGSVANVSIGKIFIAGIVPGVLLSIAMMILVGVVSVKRKYSNEMIEEVGLWKALRGAIVPLLLPIVLIGGIRLGVYTPTEAGAVFIVLAIVLSIVYKEFKFSTLLKALQDTVTTTASIMLIVGSASALAWVLTRERIPQQLSELIVSNISNKYIFLIILNVFLLFVGMFVEGNASMIVLVPLFVPIARAYGINDIQFGIVFIFNCCMGCVTPPIGTLTFVTCGITKCKLSKFWKEAIPFYMLLVACLLLLTFVPFFTTALVDLVWGK